MSVPFIPVSDYVYALPEDKIAKFPLPERDNSRLLIWNDGSISESLFTDISRFIPEGSMLVSNNTKVIHARLLFQIPTGAKIEIFCLEPWYPADYQLSFQQVGSVEWRCLVGNARRWKNRILEQWVKWGEKKVLLRAEKILKDELGFVIRFRWESNDTFATIIEAGGKIPIPPYLNREAEESDNERYQTVYARADGSVAAPTAGLHFTEAVIKKLGRKNIRFAELTLHVGAGTFQPVKSEEISGHPMHSETVIVSRTLISRLAAHKGKVIAVGTTSVRSLESLYWLGLNIRQNNTGMPLHVDQWIPYGEEVNAEASEALKNLEEYLCHHNLDHINFTTSIIIVPGYRFRMIDGMITNFHQPQSTLLMLVAAFLGPEWRKTYDYALRNRFRFLSYGDSNLYLKG